MPRKQEQLDRPSGSRIKRHAVIVFFCALVCWLFFFDSHSFLKRIQWHREYRSLLEENERLATEIEALEIKLEQGISDDVLEQVAREQYGMRKMGETVYPVEPEK